MRIVLVGTRAGRARLRLQLGEHFEVAGEFSSLAAARRSGIEADALLLAPERFQDADEGTESPEPLTARELQVLELLAEGFSNKRIASRLAISDQTVKFHVASIIGKLGAVNRTDAVRRALRQGLITI